MDRALINYLRRIGDRIGEADQRGEGVVRASTVSIPFGETAMARRVCLTLDGIRRRRHDANYPKHRWCKQNDSIPFDQNFLSVILFVILISTIFE